MFIKKKSEAAAIKGADAAADQTVALMKSHLVSKFYGLGALLMWIFCRRGSKQARQIESESGSTLFFRRFRD